MDENVNNNYQDNTENIPYQAPEEEVPNGVNGLQIASLVLGICSIVLLLLHRIYRTDSECTWYRIFCNWRQEGKHGVGTAGLVCSIIGLVFAIIYFSINAIPSTTIFDMFGISEDMLREMGYTEEMLQQIGF